jgi:hypothetical protein
MDTGTVAPIMARLAAGDPSALLDLRAVAGPVLRARLRRRVADLGGWLAPGDLDGLEVDALLALAAVARAWRADGGALPWNWAAARIDAVAVAFVGQRVADDRGDPADAPTADGPSGADDDADSRLALRSLAARRPTAAALDAALSRVATDRDAGVWLDAHRDSPAAAARLHGVRGDHARQISRRVGQRLRRLAASDPDFASLAELPALAA